MKKILVIALSGIGDALMFTPALSFLKKTHPSAQIDALIMFKGVKDIYERLPEINKIHYFDFLNNSKTDSIKFVMQLRKNNYDAIINVYPSNRKEYNLISLLISAHKRAGIKYLRSNFKELGFLNNVTVKEDDSVHNVEENIKLVEKLIGAKENKIEGLKIILNPDEIEFANQFVSKIKENETQLLIGFHPGCNTLKNHEKRRWEIEKFVNLGNRLIENFDAKILLFGGPDEMELKNGVVNKIKSCSAFSVDTKTFTQTAAVIKKVDLFITNDSSLMHTAAAMKRDVIAIIGPTNKNYIYPWKTNYKIASLELECSPCFFYSPTPLSCSRTDIQFKCIKELNVDTVYKKAVQMLQKQLS
ncbi:MAG: glycosyltransferase family 9 protein [Melioribacteraceae bacterium]